MSQQAGHEVASGARQAHLVGGVEEGVAVALEQAHVGVHPGAGRVCERFRHEGRLDALTRGDLAHDDAEGHDVVGHRQGVGVAQVDLVLAGGALVVAELDRDAHLLEHHDGVAAEVGAVVHGGVVEVAGVVERLGLVLALTQFLDEEELDLGMAVEGEPPVGGPAQGPLEHVPRVGHRR